MPRPLLKSQENRNRVRMILAPIIERRKLGTLTEQAYELYTSWNRETSEGTLTQQGVAKYIARTLENELAWLSLDTTKRVQGAGTRLVVELRCERMQSYLTFLKYPENEQRRIFEELAEINQAIRYPGDQTGEQR